MSGPWLDDGPAPWWAKLKGTQKRRASSSASSASSSQASTAPSSITPTTSSFITPTGPILEQLFEEESKASSSRHNSPSDFPHVQQGQRRLTLIPFSDMFLREPHKVGDKLRELHRARSADRNVLIDAVYEMWEDDGEWPPWEPLLTSELTAVLVEISTDAETYSHGFPGENAYADDSRKWAGISMYILRRLAKEYIRALQGNPSDKAMRTAAVKAVVSMKSLWTSIWTNNRMPSAADYQTIGQKEDGRCDYALGTILLAAEYGRLHAFLYSKSINPTDHLVHIVLHAWAIAGKDNVINIIAMDILDPVHCRATRPALDTFFKQAVTETNLTKPLAEMFRHHLLLEKKVNEPLSVLVGVLCAVSVHCPPVLHVKLEHQRLPFLQCVRIALQRQICQSDSDHRTCQILVAGLSVVKDIIEDRLQSDDGVVNELVETNKLIPMIARAMLFIVKNRDPSSFYCLKFILEKLGAAVFAESCTRLTEGLRPSYQKVVDVTRELWLPTLLDVRAQTEAKEDIREGAEHAWRFFGTSLGLNEAVEKRRRERAEEATPVSDMWPSWQGCRWKGCLCHGDRKVSHPMRVCRGCLRVHYCSTLCQTRDWTDGGHREYCRSLRQRQ